jgi:CelD/BcsL family acetyltransferase involved in cellulose biosynthesis
MTKETRVQIITNEQDLLRLASACDDLYSRAYQPLVSLSFEWVWCVWKKLMPKGKLRFICIWKRDRLVLVWPAVIVNYHRLWNAEVPVATFGDYIDYLVESSPEAEAYAQLAWENRSRDVDFNLLSHVRVSSLLHKAITKEPAKPLKTLPARYVDWSQFADWTAYYRSRSERRAIARRERRLLEVGKVSFEATVDINEVQAVSEWMLRYKETWLAARGGKSTWVGSKSYEDFLRSIPQELKKFGYVVAFALLLDGRSIAVQIAVVGESRMILLHNADDPEFRQYSPEHILTMRVLEWAYKKRLTADFCFGAEPYKEGYAPENCPVEDYRFPNSAFGRIHEFLMAKAGKKRL